ncbi:uncharacterized protein LOC132755934 isoform X4 [Ruditapes philippinarum]|uniref:uncharacterized protein LOC132755934 isoform X4 n=1 Tax=Ruditapes philippinarum TaxID=129788 RepID=UPI00295C08DA|nr:uncharacterized protein LOC132755934 isoform X4 [Ruditapes philippinarum]
MGHAFLSKLTTTLGVLACLLQIASIASPGWIIYIKGNIEEHQSLFYRRTCKTLLDESKCKVESFNDFYTNKRVRLLNAKVARETLASFDYDYNSLICQQVLMMVAVCLSTVMAISQIIQRINKDKAYQRLIFLSAATAATSAGIVIAVVSNKIVYIYYQIELYNMDDHRNHTYVGFPFCLGMLVGSVLLHFFCLAAIAPQLRTTKVKVRVRKTMEMDDSNGIDATYVPPMTKVSEVSKPTPVKATFEPVKTTVEPVITTIEPKKPAMAGYDNQVFSEKL